MANPLTLLVLSPSTGGFYFGGLLTGLTREVAAVGGRVVLVQTLEPGMRSDELGEPPDFRVPVHRDGIDGAVAITYAVGAEYLQSLQDAGIPVVVASNRLVSLEAPCALPDNHGGMFAAVEHLIEHGHTRIGFLGNLAQQDIRERHAAYRDALAAHDLPVDLAHLFHAPDNGERGGRGAAAAFLAAPSRPTALVAATDRNAMALIEELSAAGVRVPDDVAVVGFDNIEAAAYTAPPLTTVDQPFEEVGALAARLVLARIAGTPVPPVPHTSPGTVVLRGSCGCGEGATAEDDGRNRTGVLDVPGAGDTTSARRRTITERMTRPLLTGRVTRDEVVRAGVEEVLADVDRLLATPSPTPAGDIEALTASLRRLAPRPVALRHLVEALSDHVRDSAAGQRNDLSGALWHLQAESFLIQSSEFEHRLDEQFGVDGGLLDSDRSDPRDLSWLQGTHVVAGVLGLWEDIPGAGPLQLAGVHGEDHAMADLIGVSVPVEQFPPARLVELAQPDQRRICVVVPVRSRTHDWGLLALVAEIEITSAHETYHHWATLLATALDERALQQAVRASEERYAFAARAAKDGLWEWDIATSEVYVSERCAHLLGLDGEATPQVDTWTRRVLPEDVELVRDAMAQAREVRDTPVEVEFRVTADDGGRRWVLSRCLGIGPPGEPVQRLVGSVSDVQTRKELEQQLRQGALYDEVTGLPNRRLFLDRLSSAVEQPRRRPDARFAVVFLDLDGFKLINDSLGHLMGDELLRTVGARLCSDLRSVDTAARFGGDEFAVLLADPVPAEVLTIVQRIQERLGEPIQLGDHEVTVTASVGIATSEIGYRDAEDVLRDADIAMYHAKGAERGSASVFDPDMHARASGRLRVRTELRAALGENQFVVHYQPIVALDGSGLAHFEALVRWQHPDRGLLMPGAFLPAMEDNATIVALGQWMIHEVCRQVAAWARIHDGPIAVSVNLSHREFWSPALLETVDRAMAEHQMPPHSLIFEITESVIVADLDAARRVMGGLRSRGLRLHIDDFGTGQSSLHALRSFPVDALKIDGSFIRELGVVVQTTELVRIILEMGRVLGLEVVAECVENQQQADRLRGMGCRSAQGWLYSRALPGEEAGALLGICLADPADHSREVMIR